MTWHACTACGRVWWQHATPRYAAGARRADLRATPPSSCGAGRTSRPRSIARSCWPIAGAESYLRIARPLACVHRAGLLAATRRRRPRSADPRRWPARLGSSFVWALLPPPPIATSRSPGRRRIGHAKRQRRRLRRRAPPRSPTDRNRPRQRPRGGGIQRWRAVPGGARPSTCHGRPPAPRSSSTAWARAARRAPAAASASSSDDLAPLPPAASVRVLDRLTARRAPDHLHCAGRKRAGRRAPAPHWWGRESYVSTFRRGPVTAHRRISRRARSRRSAGSGRPRRCARPCRPRRPCPRRGGRRASCCRPRRRPSARRRSWRTCGRRPGG